MKRRSVQLGLAIVLALIATVAVYSYVQRADQRAVAGAKAVSVAVVVKTIPAGTSGKDVQDGGYVRIDHLPAESVPADAVRTLTPEMFDQVATVDIPAGQVLLPQMLGTKAPTTSGLAIPKGKMAVTVAITAPADVAGYVQPGSEVAVFSTFILLSKNQIGGSDSSDKADNWATKLLLPRVNVLAVSAGAPTKKNAGIDGAADTKLMVTLAVDQTEAQRLILTTERGNLYLALLSSSSVSRPGPGVDSHNLELPVFPDWVGGQS
jgi:pilus assembly protein CpaB